MRTLTFWFSLVFIFMVPWETAFVGELGSLSRIIGIVLAAFWIATVLFTGKIRKFGLFQTLTVVFLLWNAASVLWTLDVTATVSRTISLIQTTVLMVILWDLYTAPAAIRAGLQAYVLGAYVIEGILIFAFVNDPDINRYQALRTTANGTGVILAVGIPIAWYLAISARTSAKDQILKIVNYAYLPLAVFCIGLTATRFAMIMALPGMFFGITSLSQLKLGLRISVFIAVCGALLLLPSIIPERSLQRLGTVDEEIASGDLNRRTIFWQEGRHLWQQHPLLGIGSAAFESVSPSGRSMHNSFVAILAELGLIGLLLYGLIWATAIFQAWDQPRWESWFWVSLLAVLLIANSALTMAHTKRTWIFLGLLSASWGASCVKRELETRAERDARSDFMDWLTARR